MKPETGNMVFTEYIEGPDHARRELHFITGIEGGQASLRKGKLLPMGTIDRGLKTGVLGENSIDFFTGKRIGEFTGGGYTREIITSSRGREQLVVNLFAKAVGGLKDCIADLYIENQINLADLLPSVMITSGGEISLHWGEHEIGKAISGDAMHLNVEVARTGKHRADSSPLCGKKHADDFFFELEADFAGAKGRAIAHFDVISPITDEILMPVLDIISRPDFDENKLRKLIDATLILD